MNRLIPVLLFLAACPPAPESDCVNELDDDGDGLLDCDDPDCDDDAACAAADTAGGDTGESVDVDGDGFSPYAGDCDDDDSADYPGAARDHQGIAMTCVGPDTFAMGVRCPRPGAAKTRHGTR